MKKDHDKAYAELLKSREKQVKGEVIKKVSQSEDR